MSPNSEQEQFKVVNLMNRKNILLITASLVFGVFSYRTFAQSIFVNGYGNGTCGEAISHVEGNQSSGYKAIYLAWLQGYLTSKRDFYLDGNGQMVFMKGDELIGEKISNETMTQLWIAKCKKEENITKSFYYITVEIYRDIKSGKY